MPRRILRNIGYAFFIAGGIMLRLVPFWVYPRAPTLSVPPVKTFWETVTITKTQTWLDFPVSSIIPSTPSISTMTAFPNLPKPKESVIKDLNKPVCGTTQYFKSIFEKIMDTEELFRDGFVFPWILFGIDVEAREAFNSLGIEIKALFFTLFAFLLRSLWKWCFSKPVRPLTSPSSSNTSTEEHHTLEPRISTAKKQEKKVNIEIVSPPLKDEIFALAQDTQKKEPEALHQIENIEDLLLEATQGTLNSSELPVWPIPPTDTMPRRMVIRGLHTAPYERQLGDDREYFDNIPAESSRRGAEREKSLAKTTSNKEEEPHLGLKREDQSQKGKSISITQRHEIVLETKPKLQPQQSEKIQKEEESLVPSQDQKTQEEESEKTRTKTIKKAQKKGGSRHKKRSKKRR